MKRGPGLTAFFVPLRLLSSLDGLNCYFFGSAVA